MRARDVVIALAARLPQLSDAFTSNAPIRSASRSGTMLTFTCDDPHGLEAGASVAIANARTPLVVASVSRVGALGTLETVDRHDLTAGTAGTIELAGANEANFVGVFTVTRVVNRRTLEFSIADAGALTGTGTITVLGASSALQDYNATYAVLDTPTPTSFRVAHPATTLAAPVRTAAVAMEARTRPRVAAGLTPERIAQTYTAQRAADLWLFVSLGDVEASKSRSIKSDAVDNLGAGTEFRQQLLQNFTVYAYVPTSAELSAEQARDRAEEIFPAVCQSILFSQLDSGLAVGRQGRVMFTNHGFFAYNQAVYVHAFTFQQVVDLTFGDTVGHDLDVAFRDIDLALFPVLPAGGTEAVSMDAHVDLDDEPE